MRPESWQVLVVPSTAAIVVVPAGQPDAVSTTPTSPPPKPNAQPWRQSVSPIAPTKVFVSKNASKPAGLPPLVRSALSAVRVPSEFKPKFARSANAMRSLPVWSVVNQSLRSTSVSANWKGVSQAMTELEMVMLPLLRLPWTVSSLSISKHSPMPAGPVISILIIFAPVWSRNNTPSESASAVSKLFPTIVMLATLGCENAVPSPPSPSPSIPRLASEPSAACST